MDQDWAPRTKAVSAGRPTEPGAPLNTPIVPASNFLAGGGREYAREHGTETWAALEDAIGVLEGGTATAFASGMAAVTAVFELLPVGAAVMVPKFSYTGTRGYLANAHRTGRLKVVELPPEDTDVWVDATARVDLLWLESPTNPTLDLMDIKAITTAAAGRKHRPKVVVDNTFATPLGQQPLSLGADVVVHSATKVIGGHSDLLLGLAVSADDELARELREMRTRTGATPGALEAWLALRGLRTLPVRLAESTRTATFLAEKLAGHPAVVKVRYPGDGAMLAFELDGAEAADRVVEGLRLVQRATSLGGAESLAERRAALGGEERVPPGLIRLSVGLEDPDDLWRDLSAALSG